MVLIGEADEHRETFLSVWQVTLHGTSPTEVRNVSAAPF
jgi:hypothetical protein